MIIKVTFKDPDAVSEAVREAVEKEVETIEGLSGDEQESVIETRQLANIRLLNKWIKDGEYLTVEFDTRARTATIITQ